MSLKNIAITIFAAAVLTTITFILFEDFVLEPNRQDDVDVSEQNIVGEGVDVVIGEGVPLEDQVTNISSSVLVLPVFGGFMIGVALLIQRGSDRNH